jgi:hypothetical protein
MPILYHRKPYEGNCRDHATLNDIVLNEVVPNITWEVLGKGGRVNLLPNRYGASRIGVNLIKGQTLNQDPALFFIIACLHNGLSYAEVGKWLDTSLEQSVIGWTDGKKVRLIGEMESIARFDLRRPQYKFQGITRAAINYTPYS